MLDKKLTEYAEKFNENFPIFLMMGKSDEEIIRIIQKCLNDEQAFEPDTIIDALYWLKHLQGCFLCVILVSYMCHTHQNLGGFQ